MIVVRNASELPPAWQGGAVSIGNFDGVHRGHAQIVARLKELARQLHGPALIFTFDPHPAALLRPDHLPPPLMTLDQKNAALARLGVDGVWAYPTDLQILQRTPTEFFQQFIQSALQAGGMVEGPDFRFGNQRLGDIHLLHQLTSQAQMKLEVVEPLSHAGAAVSSSRIRTLLQSGNVAAAADLLGRPYSIAGRVAHGAGRGATIGFPTANVGQIATLLPAFGVYAGLAEYLGQCYPAAIHLGPNPTFGEQVGKLEVHLLGFQGNLYEQFLTVHFVERIRSVQTFAGRDALVAQLRLDVAASEEIGLAALRQWKW